MHHILIEKPYHFIPPHRGDWWPAFIRDSFLPGYWLRRAEGVEGYELRGAEHLQASLRAGHGILLTPNHCRLADPIVMGWLAREVRCLVFAMASWHLFQQSRFMAWAIHKMGGFSVYREGIDRQAINVAIEVLETAARPLVIFPEGGVSRTNDRLHALLDGVAFIARTAAKRRAKAVAGGQVVIHPVAIKYLFGGDFDATADPVLTEIEQRLSWQPQKHLPTDQRIAKVGLTLLGLKEMEYLGRTYADSLADRMQRLIDRLLCPLEEEWLGTAASGSVIPRVKALRMKIMPEMVQGRIEAPERQRRWRQLADIYLAQQISNYPPEYLRTLSIDRLLETIERFEEDLTDHVRVHGHLKAVMEVGPPIAVSPQRERHATVDPLMSEIEGQLQQMLDRLATESPLYRAPDASASRPSE
ncbi:MAG: 1-acyl-sn-glycerol-3-phosphate acyltransferase [Pirellulaceae bacterium]